MTVLCSSCKVTPATEARGLCYWCHEGKPLPQGMLDAALEAEAREPDRYESPVTQVWANVQAICTEHAETLAIDATEITADRAHRVVGKTAVQTTTELLLLLAALHADEGTDPVGAEMLATFAAAFARHETTVI